MQIVVVSVFVIAIIVLIASVFRAEIKHAEKDRVKQVDDQVAIEENRKKIRQLRAKVIRKQISKND